MNHELAKQLKDAPKLRYVSFDELVGSYHSQHQYLVRNYGNPMRCDFCELKGKKENGGRWNIHWALKKDKEYSHNKDDYYGLCRKCHGKYDLTDEKRENLKQIAAGKKGKSLVKSRIALSRKRDKYGHFIKTTA